MKFLFLILLSISSFFLHSQDVVKGNLWLRTENFDKSDRPISIMVEGGLQEIEDYLDEVNGTFNHSFRGYHSVVLPEKHLKSFLNQSFITHFIYDGGKGKPLINESKKNTKASENVMYKGDSWGTYTGKGVLMGIIDTGIDLDQPDFQDKNGKTRIVKIWDQTRNIDTTIRPSYGYGEIYDSSSINGGTCPHTDPNQHHGHGTMVSGIAVGNGNSVHDSIADYSGYASDASIVFVATDFNASNWTQTIADAVEWMYKEADRLQMPCVINLSAGTYLGSHDGQDLAALYIDSLVAGKAGRAFVSATGNAGAIPPFHLKTRVNNDTSFTWFKPNAQNSQVFIEMWADTADLKNITFTFGETDTTTWKDTTYFIDSIFNRLDTVMTINLGGGSQLLTWAERQGPNYLFQTLMTKPSASSYYKLSAIGSGGYDCWASSLLGLSDVVSTNLPNSSSYPSISKYQKQDSLQSIVSSWNCSPGLISVGTYNNRLEYENVDGNMRQTTNFPVGGIGTNLSRGPNRRGFLKPDFAAPGNFTVTSGRIVDVTYLANTASQRFKLAKGGFHFSNGGTSMASPVVAGLAALYFEKCPNGTHADFKNALLKTAFADSLTNLVGPLPNFSFGNGKVNAKAMLEYTHVYDTLISSTGKFNFCKNDSLSLSLKGGSIYSNYKWSNGDSLNQVQVNDNNYQTPWKVSFADSRGCKGYTDSVFTFQNPLPNVSVLGDSVFCKGDTDTLKAQSIDSNITWLWNNRDTSDKLVVSHAGVYWVMATGTEGCKASDSLIRHQLPYPNLKLEGDSIFCLEEGDTLKAESTDSNNVWLWSSGDTTQIIAISDSGKYWVRATNPEGCTASDSLRVKAKWCFVNIDEAEENMVFKIYPNPFNNELNVELLDNQESVISYKLIDQLGSEKQSGQLNHSNKIEFQNLASGVYFLHLKTGNTEKVFRLVRE